MSGSNCLHVFLLLLLLLATVTQTVSATLTQTVSAALTQSVLAAGECSKGEHVPSFREGSGAGAMALSHPKRTCF